MRQNELSNGKLLNVYGNLNEAGFSKSLIKEYNRKDIKASKFRIKEWDYYYIGNDSFGVAFTIADNSYMALAGVSLLDYTNKKFVTKNIMKWFTMGKLNLPSSSKIGDVVFKSKKLSLEFINDGISRTIKCHFDKFHNKMDFDCEIELFDEPRDSMVIATPFEKKRHFYYNQKINCMRARGKATIGGKVYNFKPNESFGVLDWGRGVWTYSNTWYWSSMSSLYEGKKIGFNLGYGFGDTSKASENMIFFDGVAYKTEEVTFHIPKDEKGKDDFLKPWRFTSNDGAINLVFEPIIDRKDHTNVVVIKSLQDQVFGKFSGELKFDGKTIRIDNLLGFAEKVINKW